MKIQWKCPYLFGNIIIGLRVIILIAWIQSFEYVTAGKNIYSFFNKTETPINKYLKKKWSVYKLIST